MIGPYYRCESEGYILDFYPGLIGPMAVYRVDEQGTKIPLTIEEILEWRENYCHTHPEIKQLYQKQEEENTIINKTQAAFIEEMNKRISWWNSHPLMKFLCKPFLPKWYNYYGFK